MLLQILAVVGGLVLAVIALFAIGMVLDYFLFAPRRARERAENYESRSMDPGGPFFWIPISSKRDKPVVSPTARAKERIRLTQFLLLLVTMLAAGLLVKLFLLL